MVRMVTVGYDGGMVPAIPYCTMAHLTANFNRLALYMAYRAGRLTWAQLPLTTQAACIRAGALASYTAYVGILQPQVRHWCVATTVHTGGKLTGMHATVRVATASSTASTAPYRKVA